MATATKSKSALVKPSAKQEVAIEVAPPSRREFLYYIWGASMAMLLGQATAGLIWFALPRFKEGEFGGAFTFTAGDVPPVGDPPAAIPAGRMHLSTTEDGFLALYAVCTHLGCLPKWTPGNNRFECPCHGSKFEANGDYIEGPAPRDLDRFVATITFADGTSATTDGSGNPIPLEGREIIGLTVDTGNRILGDTHG